MSVITATVSADTGIYGVPRLPSRFVERGRLLELLDQPAPLTLVRTPAGFGKTALVSHWARRRQRQGVWVTIDAHCASRLDFWRRVDALLDPAGVRFGGRSTFAAHGDLRGSVLALGAALSSPMILVIDSFDRISDGEVVDDLLALVRHSDHVRLVVLTRTEGTLEDPAVQLEFQPHVIDGRHLRLTREETKRVLTQAGADRIDPGVVQEVTGGVPFAVRVVGLEATPADSPATLAGRLNRYVLKSVHHSYGRSAFARFLLRTSPAEELNVEIAAALAKVTPAAAARHLAQAEADGLGLWTKNSVAGADSRFSFVPMVRSALWSELRRASPDKAKELSRRYACWSMSQGDHYASVCAAVRGGDLALASKAMRRGFFSVSTSDSARTVEALEAIPRRMLREHPVLALFLATQYNATGIGRAKARDMFKFAAASAAQLWRTEQGDEAERFSLAVVETLSSRMIGRTEVAVAAAGRVLQLYRALSPAARRELDELLTPVLMLVGNQFWQVAEVGRALEVYAEADRVATSQAADVFTVPLLAAGAATVGHMPTALEWLERARKLEWPPDEKDDYLGCPYHLAEAIAALERFDLAAAAEHVRAVERALPAVEYWSWFTPIQAYLDAAGGRPHAALVRMRALLDDVNRPPLTPQLRAVHDVVTGLLHVSAGELVLAERAVGTHPKAALGGLVVRALSALASDAADQAFAITRALQSQPRNARFTAVALLLHAAAAVRLGERAVARISVERAAALMDLNGIRTPLTFLPPGDLRAVAELGVLPPDWLTGVPHLFPDAAPRYELTPRELRLLKRLATTDGTLIELAADLHVSVNTLRAQRASLYRKLGVSSRSEAVCVAESAGLLTDVVMRPSVLPQQSSPRSRLGLL